MTTPAQLSFVETHLDALADLDGRIAVVVGPTGKLDQTGRRLNRLMRGALERFVGSETFAKMKEGDAKDLGFPSGLVAEAVQVVKLDRKPDPMRLSSAAAAGGRVQRHPLLEPRTPRLGPACVPRGCGGRQGCPGLRRTGASR